MVEQNWVYLFRGFFAAASDYIFLAGFNDQIDPDMQLTKVFQYTSDDNDWLGMPELKWRFASIADYKVTEGFTAVLSEEGDIFLSGNTDSYFEKIPESGVRSPGAKGWGYMRHIQQIGDHLYACGASGQVYKRVGPDQWVHMDDGILQEPRQPKDTEDRYWLTCIGGPSEHEIYAVGDYGLIFFWDGNTWTRIDCPERKCLGKFHIESSDRIWICGHKGVLLLGNHRDGFVNVSPTEELLFTSITMFQKEIYLASDQGLYRFEEKQRRLRKVKTPGLNPPHTDSHYLGAKDGVLWSVGVKDIVWTDGTTWHRVQHPDNPPYGTEQG